ncbi:aminoglycoside phosphotransferase family protein [Pseudonocardia sp. 73-21]|uniref:phosphotransferase family protein n=1 Tax=Pseudonocardia sp. 73-21 TaxID=1895809 RepID=UPI0026206AAF|nr:aminoglycoside phosphotransferase family protein [Pseudonocardia sp. 73-21]
MELIRMGSNGVFRLGANVVARVAPDLALLANADKQIAAARWFKSVGLSVAPALAIEQPIAVNGCVVTLWKSVCDGEVYAPIAEVARLIRELHQLMAPAGLELPQSHPFGDSSMHLPSYQGLDVDDAEFLKKRYRWARESFDSLPFVLERGVIHGDANVGNVLLGDDGRAVLIDLDSVSIGPREYDLIQTAIFAERFGWHTDEEYATFVEVYGWDIMQWEGYEDLAAMREISMTSWLAKKAAGNAAAAKEATKRIHAIRTGGSRRDWGAY